MKILILGPARNGKDSLAELWNENFGMTFKSSSEMANELFIYDELKDKYGYSTIEECFEDRMNRRTEWYKMICGFNKDDKARLTKAILENYDCYVGMRDDAEFEASKHLFDLIVWVDASERVDNPDSSNKISKNDAHIVITNNSDWDSFVEKSNVVGNLIFKK